MSGNKEFLESEPQQYDPSRYFLEAIPRMIRMARRAARNDAISYRDVKVGAAIMFYEPGLSEAILSGANLKAKPTDEKYCAEMDVIDQAQELGLENAVGLVIAGPSKAPVVESISDMATSTLHPCDSCQEKMMENSHIIKDDTLIVTASTEEDLYQVHYAQELRMLYGAVETRELMFMESATKLDFSSWDERIDLYDRLKARSPFAFTQHMAKIALENIVEIPEDDD